MIQILILKDSADSNSSTVVAVETSLNANELQSKVSNIILEFNDEYWTHDDILNRLEKENIISVMTRKNTIIWT